MVVNASSPYKTVADILAKAKKDPGKLSFGSDSSSSRVASELVKQMAGVDILYVPYKSNTLAITDRLGGQIDMMITDKATDLPHIKWASFARSASRRKSDRRCCPTCRRSTRPASRATTWATGSRRTHRRRRRPPSSRACASC